MSIFVKSTAQNRGELKSPQSAKAGKREWLALAVLMLPVLLVSVDNTVLSFAIPAISRDFNTTGTALLWIIDIYPLVLAALLVAMGSLGDRFGRRRLLIIGAIGFGVLSVLAAYSPNAESLIATRVGMGFFGAMLMPSTLSLLRNIFTDRNQRRLAIAIWGSGFSAGAALGPIVGGILLEHFWWGSIFLLAIPVLLLMLAFTPLFVPESKDPNPGPIDVPSTLLSIATMAPVVFAIKNIAKEGDVAISVLAVVVGVLAGTAFVRRQLTRLHPLLDVRLFTYRPFTGSVLVNLLAIFSLVGFLYFVSQHLQLVLGLSPLNAALVLVPGLVITILAGLAVVPVAKKVPAHVLVPVALLFSVAAYAMIALNGHNESIEVVMIAFAVLGAGVGASETISNDVILASVPSSKAGAASAVSETAYEVGSVFGTALLGSVLVSSYRSHLNLPSGLSPEQATIATDTLGGALNMAASLPGPAAQELITSAQAAFTSGVTATSWIGAGLMVLAAAMSFRMLRETPTPE